MLSFYVKISINIVSIQTRRSPMNGFIFMSVLFLLPMLGIMFLFVYYREGKKKVYRNDLHKYIDETLNTIE